MLLHLVSAQEEDVVDAYRTVRAEMEAYGHGLADKPEVLVLSQIDIADEPMRVEKSAALKEASGHDPLLLSSATREGVEDVLRALMTVIGDARAADRQSETQDEPWQPLAADR